MHSNILIFTMAKVINLIKRPIIAVLNSFSRWKRELLWCKQTRYWRSVLVPKSMDSMDTASRYLILAPHSDDEWIGCSQIITQCENAVILNMDMPGGDSKEMHKERFGEMGLLANRFNRLIMTVGENKAESLAEIIASLKPDYICLPHFFDWHPEHIQVMQYLRQALTQVSYSGKVLMYQVSLPMHPDFVNCVVPLDKKTFKQKWEIFKVVYKTQTFLSYPRFMANERINGALDNSYAAEVYSKNDINQWLGGFEVLLLTSSEIEEARNSLQDIAVTRKNVMKYLNARTMKNN